MKIWVPATRACQPKSNPFSIPRMTAGTLRNAFVLYWGRGLRLGPSEYGFLMTHEPVPRVLYFDRSQLAADSVPPEVGLSATLREDAETGTHAFKVELSKYPVSAPQPPACHRLALGRVVAAGQGTVQVVTLPGKCASLTWGGCESVDLQVGDYVRCRLIESVSAGSEIAVAFDGVRIDFNDPVEQARLDDYLRSASGEVAAAAIVAPVASATRPKRNRKSPWAGLTLVERGFKYDRNRRELALPANRKAIPIPTHFCYVLEELLRCSARSGNEVPGPGSLGYARMAELFERGRLKKRRLGHDLIEEEIQRRGGEIRLNSKKIAQEFVRQLSRWLRRRKINPDRFLQAEPEFRRYRLGDGWNEEPAMGGTESHSKYKRADEASEEVGDTDYS